MTLIMLEDTLHLSAVKGQLGAVRILLEAGAQPALSCKCGRTALHCAGESGSLPVTKLLLEMGADYNVRDHLGNTVLHRAATVNDGRDVVDLLLQLGLPIDAMNTIGWTALMEAVNFGCEDLCEYFSITARTRIPVNGHVSPTLYVHSIRA